MNRKYAKELFRKYNNGTATEEERKLLDNWYAHMLWERRKDPFDEDLIRQKHEAWLYIYKQTAPVKGISIWQRISIAAAVVVFFLGFGLLFDFYSEHNSSQNRRLVYEAEVSPGHTGATLTLSNGKKIILSDTDNGEVAKEAGVLITKSENGELSYQLQETSGRSSEVNMLSTANGETYKLRLPDGSIVWLNAASSIRYPVSFAQSRERIVELSGEAYFEVARDRVHPFIVKNKHQAVEVLGTHFNVSSYEDEQLTKTTLLEGSVKVFQANNKQYRLLTPGEQAATSYSSIVVKKVNVANEVAWQRGEFSLEGKSFEQIMKELARWYNIDVHYTKAVPQVELFGALYRTDNIKTVLKLLETNGINYRLKKRTLFIGD